MSAAVRPEPTQSYVQLPAYASGLFYPHRYKVLYGGRGAGRSWSVARALLLRCAQRTTRVLCTREMQSSLRDSVHQLLRDQIGLMNLPGFRVTDREIRHENGSLFLFEGLRHNITKVKSLEGIDVCWVEEAERISKRSWSVLIPTIRRSGSEIWITYNPDLEDDATHQRFVIHTPKDTWLQKVGWEDNPWLSDELRAEKDYAYETDPDAADHIWGGNVRTANDAQILRNKWTVQEFTVPLDKKTGAPAWQGPYQGEDFGFGADPAAAVRVWVHDRTLYVEHEMHRHHLELDDTPQALEDAIPGFALYVTRADSSRPDSISYLKRHGVPKIAATKKGAGSVEDGIAHLRAYRQIIIHPRCRHTVDEAKLYSYKVDENSGDVLPVVVDKHNHIIDSIRYALEPMIQPRRMAGFLFANAERDDDICPRCSSKIENIETVPEGEAVVCEHCDWRSDEKEVEEAAEEDASMEVIKERVRALTTRPENGHSNGNGNGHATNQRFRSLRGLNG